MNGYDPNPLGSDYFTFAPIPTQSLHYTIPAGSAGTTVPVTVTNADGSTTAAHITYLPAVQQYPVTGTLVDGIYDSHRDVYYFSDATQIRRFSLTQGKWLSAIPVPPAKSSYGPERLFGLALSLDGSKLAISDPGTISIYVLDPDQPTSIRSVNYATQLQGEAITAEPSGIAVENNGTVYFNTFDLDGDGGDGYMYRLDASTGTVKQVTGEAGGGDSLGTSGPDPDGRLVMTSDGTRIYFNDSGELGYIDTAAAEFVTSNATNNDLGQSGYEIVLGADQTRLFADGFMTDSNLNPTGLQTLDTAAGVDAQYVYGGALSTDGSLYFQPGVQPIDVFDGRAGSFLYRVALPVPLSRNYRALVSNNKDSRLVAITGKGDGIAVIDLNSLPEPLPVSYIALEASPFVRSTSSAVHSHKARTKKMGTGFGTRLAAQRASSSLQVRGPRTRAERDLPIR